MTVSSGWSRPYACFEGDLPGAILHHTAAVDHFLAARTPRWNAPCQPRATPLQGLHKQFTHDVTKPGELTSPRSPLTICQNVPLQGLFAGTDGRIIDTYAVFRSCHTSKRRVERNTYLLDLYLKDVATLKTSDLEPVGGSSSSAPPLHAPLETTVQEGGYESSPLLGESSIGVKSGEPVSHTRANELVQGNWFCTFAIAIAALCILCARCLPSQVAFLPSVLTSRPFAACFSFTLVPIYCFMVQMTRSSLPHFRRASMEHEFLVWFNRAKHTTDKVSFALWLFLGGSSLVRLSRLSSLDTLPGIWLISSGALATIAALSCFPLTWQTYGQKRENLVIYIRLTSSMVALVLQSILGSYLQRYLPSLTLMELVVGACIPIRLSSYVTLQVLQALVTLCINGSSVLLIHAWQFVAFGVCVPALAMYSSELKCRKEFAAMYPKHKKWN